MRSILVDTLLSLAVAGSWLGAAGFVRLRSPLDRMHCVTFLNVSAGAATLFAALASDGPSSRVAKILLLIVASLWVGAALAHATGRALRLREAEE